MLEAFELYNDIKDQVLVIQVEKKGNISAGTAFHIGDGLLVTARHNLEDSKFTIETVYGESVEYGAFHCLNDEDADVAIIQSDYKSSGIFLGIGEQTREPAKFIKIGSYFAPSDLAPLYLLDDVFIFGFPPIPMTKRAELVAVRAQVNALVNTRHSNYSVFILSSIARGGFSGGPVIDQNMNLIGVCIEALFADHKPIETGFAAAICIDPLLDLLYRNRFFPTGNDQFVRDWENRKKFLHSSPKEEGKQ
jgi:hypothetical protein